MSYEKLAQARELSRKLAGTPFVRLIALGNSVAFGTATQLSDFDCFVVTTRNRLWTARFFLLVRAKWRGLAKRAGATSDRFDFGWWVDESAMDLSRGAIRDDVHLRYWLACLVPLFERDSAYRSFIDANRWIQSQLPNWRPPAPLSLPKSLRPKVGATSQVFPARAEPILAGWFGDVVERILFWIQRGKILVEPIARRPGADVVATPHECKLHHLDGRMEIRDHWRVLVNNSTDPAGRGRKRRSATGS